MLNSEGGPGLLKLRDHPLEERPDLTLSVKWSRRSDKRKGRGAPPYMAGIDRATTVLREFLRSGVVHPYPRNARHIGRKKMTLPQSPVPSPREDSGGAPWPKSPPFAPPDFEPLPQPAETEELKRPQKLHRTPEEFAPPAPPRAPGASVPVATRRTPTPGFSPLAGVSMNLSPLRCADQPLEGLDIAAAWR